MRMRQAWNAVCGSLLFAATHGVVAAPVETTPAYETFAIASAPLAEMRTINVYLPPGYADAANEDTRYPVLYMPDGGV